MRRNTTANCTKHHDPLKVYCETCDKVICRDCTISEDHNAHKFKLITECFSEHHQELKNELSQLKKRMGDVHTTIVGLTTRHEQVLEQGETIKDEIEIYTKQVIEYAQRSERRLLEQLDQLVKRKTQMLNGQREQAERVHKQLKTCQEVIEQRLNDWNKEQILLEKHRMINRMKWLTQITEPTTFIPIERADFEFVKNLATEKGVGEITSNFFEKAYVEMPSSCQAKVESIATLHLESKGAHFSIPSLLVSSFLYSCHDKSKLMNCEVRETKPPGEYNISFTPSTRGQYQLMVQVGGIDVPGSPFVILVADKPTKVLTGIKGPRGIAVCEDGNIVVAECDLNRVSVYNKKGKKLKSFNGGKKNDSFIYPRGVALSSDDGCILVTDNHRLQKITFTGSLVKLVTTSEKKRKLNWPIGIAVHPTTGNICVTDSDDNHILVYEKDLTYSHTIVLHGDRAFKKPRFATFDKDGFLYVADSGNHCIKKLTITGEFIKRFGSRGSVPGQLYLPYGVSVDTKNMVHVVEEGNNRVSVFNSDGNFFDCYGTKGSGEGEFDTPCCIATNESGNIFISDTENGRIIVF